MENLTLKSLCMVIPLGSVNTFPRKLNNFSGKIYCSRILNPCLTSPFVRLSSKSLSGEEKGFQKSRVFKISNSSESSSKKRKSRPKISEVDENFLSSPISSDRLELISEKSLVALFGKDEKDLPELGSMSNLGIKFPSNEADNINNSDTSNTNNGTNNTNIGSTINSNNGYGGDIHNSHYLGSKRAEEDTLGFDKKPKEEKYSNDLWMQIRGEKEVEGDDDVANNDFQEKLKGSEENGVSRKVPEWDDKWDQRRRVDKEEEEEEEEEDMNRRFKLRNGKEVFEERAFLIGVELKLSRRKSFSTDESLDELAQLAETAGLKVVGSTYQRLEHPNPKTYIGVGKVGEIKAAILAHGVETIVFDDELSPGQLRNLEKEFGDKVRVCDRTALILDIFSQRAATKEATLQVELAQTEYQLPRLTRMWSHLERQAGGLVKGMGEKQIEVDKRILRTRISILKRSLETVREHRQQYRDRRAATPIPVASLVGYTNAGKSTLLNRLSGAGVLAEDKLFATLDPTTRRVQLPSGKDCLVTDTVGFIQKLPTQLVAAFRATLEEISQASLLLHVVDISHPMVEQQTQAVENVLEELEVDHVPVLSVWNKIDKSGNPRALRRLAERRGDTVCISALSGEGMDDFYALMEDMIKDLLVPIEAVIPYDQMDLIHVIHRLGMVESEEYLPEGTYVNAHVPLSLSRQLASYDLQLSTLDMESQDFGSDNLSQMTNLNFSNIPGRERIIEIDA